MIPISHVATQVEIFCHLIGLEYLPNYIVIMASQLLEKLVRIEVQKLFFCYFILLRKLVWYGLGDIGLTRFFLFSYVQILLGQYKCKKTLPTSPYPILALIQSITKYIYNQNIIKTQYGYIYCCGKLGILLINYFITVSPRM